MLMEVIANKFVMVLLFLSRYCYSAYETVQSLSPGEYWIFDRINDQKNGLLISAISVSPPILTQKNPFWKLEIGLPFNSKNNYNLKVSSLPAILQTRNPAIFERSKLIIKDNSLLSFIISNQNSLLAIRSDIIEGELLNHRMVPFTATSRLLDFDFEFKSDKVFLLSLVKLGTVKVNSFLLHDDEMFGDETISESRIIVLPSPVFSLSQVLVYKRNYNKVWLLRFQEDEIIHHSKHDLMSTVTKLRVALNRILIMTLDYSVYAVSISKTIDVESNYFITLGSDFVPNFPTEAPKKLVNGRFTFADSLSDGAKMRLVFIELIYGPSDYELSTNLVHFDPLANDDIQIEFSRIFGLRGKLTFDDSVSWVEGDYSIHYVYLYDVNRNRYELNWITFLDTMQNIQLGAPRPLTFRFISAGSKHGFFSLYNLPINYGTLLNKSLIFRQMKKPFIRITLIREPTHKQEFLNLTVQFTNQANTLNTSVTVRFESQKAGIYEGSNDLLRLKEIGKSTAVVDQFKKFPIRKVLEGSFIMSEDSNEKHIEYFNYIISNNTADKINEIVKSGFFELEFGVSSISGAFLLQDRIDIEVKLEEYFFLNIVKYSTKDFYLFDVKDEDNYNIETYTQEKQILSGSERLKKYIYFRRFLFILNSNLDIQMIDLIRKSITQVELPGKKCIDIEIVILQNLPPLLMCHIDGLEFNLYFLSDILKGRNANGLINYRLNSIHRDTFQGSGVILITSQEFGDRFYMLFKTKDNSLPVMFRIKVNVLESISIDIDNVLFLGDIVKATTRKGYIIDAIAVNERIIILSSISKIQSINICEISEDTSLKITNRIEITPFLSIAEDSKFYRIGKFREYNIESSTSTFSSLAIKVKTPMGWNLLYIDPFQYQSNIIPTFILPADSKSDFNITTYYYLEEEYMARTIGIEFSDPASKSLESCIARVEFSEPSFSLRMVANNKLEHSNLMTIDTDQLLGQINKITYKNRKSGAKQTIVLRASFESSITPIKTVKENDRQSLLIPNTPRTIAFIPLTSNRTIGDVFIKEYIFEKESDLYYGRAAITPFYQELNSITVDIRASIMNINSLRFGESKKVILRTESPIGYIIVEDNSIMRNSRNISMLLKNAVQIITTDNESCRMGLVLGEDIILEVCLGESSSSSSMIRIIDLKRIEINEINIHLVLPKNSQFNFKSFGNNILIEAISRRGGVSDLRMIQLDIHEGKFNSTNTKVLYRTQLNSKMMYTKNSIYDLLIVEIRIQFGKPYIQLRRISDLSKIKNFSNIESLFENIYSFYLDLIYPQICKHPSDFEISREWIHNYGLRTVVYFTDFRDQLSVITALSTELNRPRITLIVHNPFSGLRQQSMIPPICKNNICISATIFKETSYLKFYCIPVDFGKVVTDKNSKNIQNINETSLMIDYILYTHTILNLSLVLTGMEWDPSPLRESESLYFYIFSKKKIKYYKINLQEGITVSERLESDTIKVRYHGALTSVAEQIFEIKSEETSPYSLGNIRATISMSFIAVFVVVVIWTLIRVQTDETPTP